MQASFLTLYTFISILGLENIKQNLFTKHQQTSDELTQLRSQQSTTEDDPSNESSHYEERIKELENEQKLTSQKLQEVENKIREVEASIKSKCMHIYC